MTRSRGPDRLGTVLCAIMLTAFWLPFVIFKSNRIVPGDPRGLAGVLHSSAAVACYTAWIAVGVTAICVSNARIRLMASLAGLVVLFAAVALAADLLTPGGNKVV